MQIPMLGNVTRDECYGLLYSSPVHLKVLNDGHLTNADAFADERLEAVYRPRA